MEWLDAKGACVSLSWWAAMSLVQQIPQIPEIHVVHVVHVGHGLSPRS